MKREAKKLMRKAVDSLTLSVEHFNRPHDTGRICAVLILLDHAMEMLLKGSIVERGGSITNISRPGQTIGFDLCVGRALSDGEIQFLTDDQARLLRSINAQRDAAQHYLVDISENLLYTYVQAGFTVFREILKDVFNLDLGDFFPDRVLPISTQPPLDIMTLFETEVEEIKKLIRPNTRRKLEAEARLRSLIMFDAALLDESVSQPSRKKLRSTMQELHKGTDWQDIFPGILSTEISASGEGHRINLYVNKKEGLPVRIAKEGEDTHAVLLKPVNDFDKYSMIFTRLCEHLGLNRYEGQALIWYTNIKDDIDCYKEFKRGSVVIKGYSQEALRRLRDTIRKESIAEIVAKYKVHVRNSKK